MRKISLPEEQTGTARNKNNRFIRINNTTACNQYANAISVLKQKYGVEQNSYELIGLGTACEKLTTSIAGALSNDGRMYAGSMLLSKIQNIIYVKLS